MTDKRDRRDEGQVYISKLHRQKLKRIAELEGRNMRSTLERWIDHYALHRELPLSEESLK